MIIRGLTGLERHEGLNVALRGSDSPCKGRLEVYHGVKEQWGLVCHYGWRKENGEVVCKSIGCGDHTRSDVEMTLYKDPPLPQQYWMDQVKCTSGEESLWKCLYVGISNNEECDGSFVAVECSGEVKLSLNLNGQRDVCAGVVEFSTANGIIGVCNDEWSNKICRELGCGDLHYSPKPGMFKGQQSKRNVFLKCVGDEKFSWQCMERSDCRERASVICSNHRRFSLRDGSDACSGWVEEKTVKQKSWNPVQPANVKPEVICPQLNCGSTGNFTKGTNILTCSDRVKLQNFTADCFGDVSIAVNGIKYEVCYSDQDSIESRKKMGAMVCRELGCGSLDVRLSDGLGRCSGRVEVKWEGSWRPIGSERNTMNSDVVCKHLNCDASSKINRQLFTEGEKGRLQWLWDVSCRSSSAKLHECFENTGLRTPSLEEKNKEIICQKEELKFFEGDSPCKGKVRIKQFYDKAVWLPATPEKANDTCKAMQCGTLVSFEKSQTTDAKVKCSGSKTLALENSLGEKCWGMVKVCGDGKCGGVCSNNWRTDEDSKMISWKRLLLYNKEGECSGPVYGLRDNGKTPTPVSISGWGNEEGQKLCEYLQCGKHIPHISNYTNTNTKEWWNNTYNCSGKENIWECESNDQPVQNQQQLNIKCDHKPPKIRLSNNCTGKVLIDEEHVCASRWDAGMSNKLCDSLNCGKALYSWTTESREKNTWHFSCTGNETLMWQCGSRKDSCENILSVACKDSVEFNSTEKCGGKLVIKYQGRWEYVCGKLTPNDNKKFCDVLKCNDSRELLEEQIIEKEIKVKINCPETHYNIFQCMHHLNNDKCSHGPAEIKCGDPSENTPTEGYTQKTEDNTPKTAGYTPNPADNTPKGGNSSVGLILGLSGAVLGLLILFLMWRNRKRLLLALRYYRSKKGKDVNPDVNEMDKMDTEDKGFSEGKAAFFDNDDYEDVDSLMDKSGEEDEDDRKRDSSGTEYDDIEGQANGISPSQTHHDEDLDIPLLPKRPENILDQDTYEVETEKQKDCDDVISVEATANENAGMTGTQAQVDVDVDEGADSDLDAGLFANADADMLTTEVEVHAQAE
ncbi:scavenger receptor cysteine-rich type 1 protein M130-like [Carassius auratus]|uniref:Scavenger receptor cysteine-rich type 1 protein M130-like n=1 Tax=Carassius auratus TaxID=7957 RepID=A0A6P6N1N9_CARAU|nr:scavenger receptor cysteine-rich type 1 protein M130-like [Carassius auratus]